MGFLIDAVATWFGFSPGIFRKEDA